jgi:signal transduction histidine kinase
MFRVVRPETGVIEWIEERARVDGGRLVGAARVVERDGQAEGRVEREVERLGAALQVREQELQTLLDVLPVGVFIAHDPGCLVISSNPAGARLLRLPSSADNASKSAPGAEALPFRTFRDGREIAADELPMQRSAASGATILGEELELRYSDGAAVTLHESVAPLFDPAGRVRGCVGVFVDITARKRAEDALRRADQRKDEFLATLAHELRNPLAPIRNAVEVMQRLRGAGERVEWATRVIDRQLVHLSRLIDDLLDVSRISRGAIGLHPQRVAVQAIVEQALETCRPLLDRVGHRVSVTLPHAPALVDADPTRLVQVVANLLNNAAKFTLRGGHIELVVRRDGPYVELVVRDDGIGIPADKLGEIFEMFAQVDTSVERAHGGLGIGLTIVRLLVELHGGTVVARSRGPGRGSEFIVRLLAADGGGAAAEPSSRTPVAHASAGRRVLVVDDNTDAAESLAMLLECEGHVVRVAHDGPSALVLARELSPEVILLDLGMPTMSGYEVAQRVRAELGAGVVLVAVTGWGQAEDRRRTREAGFDHHLVKPLDFDSLRAILARPAGAGG